MNPGEVEILLLLLFILFLSGVEIAFIFSYPYNIKPDRKQGSFSARIIDILSRNPAKFHSGILSGYTIALVLYGILMAAYLEPFARLLFSSSVGIIITQVILSALVILITAEFLPKIIFRLSPGLILHRFSLPTTIVFLIFYPIGSFLVWISDIIIRGSQKGNRLEISSGKLFHRKGLFQVIGQSGNVQDAEILGENDLELFRNALDFTSVKVRDCMVPRTEIVAAEVNESVKDLLQKFISTGFSKILIYQENIDNIIGYITSKTLLRKIISLKDNLAEVPFAPETMPAHRLLQQLIQEKKSIAVVVDEFGGVSGMLTTEDIIEEIFGEIEDEHDTIELIEKQISKNEFIFSGRLEIDYINEKYKLNIPESEEYETLAGFIFHYHENIPQLNEQIIIEPFFLKILKVSKTRIELVQLKIITGKN